MELETLNQDLLQIPISLKAFHLAENNMDKVTKRGSADPASSSPRTSLGYGDHRIPQSYLQFLNSQLGERSEKFTLPFWLSCISCHYSGGCTLNLHKQFTVRQKQLLGEA